MNFANAKAIVNDAIAASRKATAEQKDAARVMAFELRGKSDAAFAYNGYLLLVSRGVRPTESNVLTEAKKLRTAQQVYHRQADREAAA